MSKEVSQKGASFSFSFLSGFTFPGVYYSFSISHISQGADYQTGEIGITEVYSNLTHLTLFSSQDFVSLKRCICETTGDF